MTYCIYRFIYTLIIEFIIATYNVNGIANPTKRKAIFDYLGTIPATMFLLQETHSIAQFEQAWTNEWKLVQSIFHSSHENKHQSGVATLVDSKHFCMEKVSNDLNGRILHVKIFYNTEILNIINIYPPSGKSNRTQNHRFFENLYPYIPLHHPTILAGDFNCVENPQLDKPPCQNILKTSDPTGPHPKLEPR